MLSPIAAPRMAARIITGSGIRPAAADTPPRMTAISPGNTNPMNADDSRAGSRKTASSTAQPGSSSKRSGIDAVIVGQRIHPRPRVRAPPPKAARWGRSDLLDAQRVLPPGVPVVDLDVECAGLPRAEGRVLVGGGASRDRRERRAGAAFAKASRCELPDVLRAGVPDPQIEVLATWAVQRHRVPVPLDQALLVDVVVVGRPGEAAGLPRVDRAGAVDVAVGLRGGARDVVGDRRVRVDAALGPGEVPAQQLRAHTGRLAPHRVQL